MRLAHEDRTAAVVPQEQVTTRSYLREENTKQPRRLRLRDRAVHDRKIEQVVGQFAVPRGSRVLVWHDLRIVVGRRSERRGSEVEDVKRRRREALGHEPARRPIAGHDVAERTARDEAEGEDDIVHGRGQQRIRGDWVLLERFGNEAVE